MTLSRRYFSEAFSFPGSISGKSEQVRKLYNRLKSDFSELDEVRSAALVALLPQGQAVLTSAGSLPSGVEADHRYLISAGKVEAG